MHVQMLPLWAGVAPPTVLSENSCMCAIFPRLPSDCPLQKLIVIWEFSAQLLMLHQLLGVGHLPCQTPLRQLRFGVGFVEGPVPRAPFVLHAPRAVEDFRPC